MTYVEPTTDESTVVLVIILIFLFLFVFINVVSFFLDFARDLRYINMEIRRSIGSEQRYWKRCRRKLWLSLIPFVHPRDDDE